MLPKHDPSLSRSLHLGVLQEGNTGVPLRAQTLPACRMAGRKWGARQAAHSTPAMCPWSLNEPGRLRLLSALPILTPRGRPRGEQTSTPAQQILMASGVEAVLARAPSALLCSAPQGTHTPQLQP